MSRVWAGPLTDAWIAHPGVYVRTIRSWRRPLRKRWGIIKLVSGSNVLVQWESGNREWLPKNLLEPEG